MGSISGDEIYHGRREVAWEGLHLGHRRRRPWLAACQKSYGVGRPPTENYRSQREKNLMISMCKLEAMGYIIDGCTSVVGGLRMVRRRAAAAIMIMVSGERHILFMLLREVSGPPETIFYFPGLFK